MCLAGWKTVSAGIRFPAVQKDPCEDGLPEIRFHDLRHTAGSLLLADGVDIKTIQQFLGHSQASTTLNIYLHGLTRGGEVAANSMGRLLK